MVRGPKMKYCTRVGRDVFKVCSVLEFLDLQKKISGRKKPSVSANERNPCIR